MAGAMRGGWITLAAGFAAAMLAIAPARATAATERVAMDALAREKMAAVMLVRTKARKYAAALANGRLMQAYLSAATQTEAERLKSRIIATLKTLQNRYGIEAFRIIWRNGDVFASIGAAQPPMPRRRQELAQGLAQTSGAVSMLLGTDSLTFVTPVSRDGESELVLSVEQHLSAYERVLTHGIPGHMKVMIVDANGRIVTDTSGASRSGDTARIAGMTIDDLRMRLSAGAAEGAGFLLHEGHRLEVSYQSVDGWTVTALQAAPDRTPCLRGSSTSCR